MRRDYYDLGGIKNGRRLEYVRMVSAGRRCERRGVVVGLMSWEGSAIDDGKRG